MDAESFILNSKDQIILDVRSPNEFAHAHISQALNLPLFTDEQRAIVGTIYKKQGREQAIKAGLDFFGPNMKSIVESVENSIRQKHQLHADLQILPDKFTLFIYCWRGGMRSSAIAWLLGIYGFKSVVLLGGYKAFRNWALEQFKQNYTLKILSGFTGSGKTNMLQKKLFDGENVIDLEKLASHKGSAFGHINMPVQPSQEMFENILALHLFDSQNKTIWLEDECQRLGHVYIPSAFWQSMLHADIEHVDVSFDQRLNNILDEYGGLNKNLLIEATLRISKRLGGLDTTNTIEYINEGKIREAFKILLSYYDRQYLKASQKKKFNQKIF
jgi:tRNA 2-selenouridine synthase